jgi:hypothetical protein
MQCEHAEAHVLEVENADRFFSFFRVTAWQSDEMDKLYRDMNRCHARCLEPVSDTRTRPSSDDVVQIHPPFPRWVDVPVVEKTTPYRMQPMYHDPVEDFLWLPRDPLSRLDLDDTVECESSFEAWLEVWFSFDGVQSDRSWSPLKAMDSSAPTRLPSSSSQAVSAMKPKGPNMTNLR